MSTNTDPVVEAIESLKQGFRKGVAIVLVLILAALIAWNAWEQSYCEREQPHRQALCELERR